MSTYRGSGPVELGHSNWHKSTYSANSGNCVEVTELTGGHRAVRDTKNPTGPVLIFTPAGWSAFTTGVRNGAFS